MSSRRLALSLWGTCVLLALTSFVFLALNGTVGQPRPPEVPR